jgi:hypothetical protein
LSSTTDRRKELGQALVIFTGAMLALALVAALAFDIGMIMLERRAEQNAADAAALGGARCLEIPRVCDPVARAQAVALENDYGAGTKVDGAPSKNSDATVSIGAGSSRIEVTISRDLPSLFAGVIGRATWHVSAFAVAVNLNDQAPFASFVALNPDACGAITITGTGVVKTNGDIQVNSNCPDSAMLISGQGDLELEQDGLACWVVGGEQVSGKGTGTLCDPPQPGVPLNWPVNGMPPTQSWPKPVQLVQDDSGKSNPPGIPAGCPGGTSSPETTGKPMICQFTSSYDGMIWRLYPGLYAGGIKLQAGTFYLEPGIYELGGGGFVSVATGVSVTSVDAGGTTLGGGVLLFNTTYPGVSNGPIQIGGSGNSFNLWPLGGYDENCTGPTTSQWERYLIFQDPAVTNTLVINGGGNVNSARGLIFAPSAQVQINGGTGYLTIDAVIADTFKINGNGGEIDVLYDKCALPTFTGYGLVNTP